MTTPNEIDVAALVAAATAEARTTLFGGRARDALWVAARGDEGTPTRLVPDARDLVPGDVILRACDGAVCIPGGMVVVRVLPDATVGCGFRIEGTQDGKPFVLTPPECLDIFSVKV